MFVKKWVNGSHIVLMQWVREDAKVRVGECECFSLCACVLSKWKMGDIVFGWQGRSGEILTLLRKIVFCGCARGYEREWERERGRERMPSEWKPNLIDRIGRWKEIVSSQQKFKTESQKTKRSNWIRTFFGARARPSANTAMDLMLLLLLLHSTENPQKCFY